ncbi:hypothetical protein [Mesorhizobium sp. M0239]|uniref:hypothetical protein n=1 Tax=Mesorhizobium sp. M0239 TaxID=2956924 RepID=UPI003335AE8F
MAGCSKSIWARTGCWPDSWTQEAENGGGGSCTNAALDRGRYVLELARRVRDRHPHPHEGSRRYPHSIVSCTTATPVLVDSYFVSTPAGRTPTIVKGGYVLNGTTGADYLWGLGGNDTLIGGKGNDLARRRQPAQSVRVLQGRWAGYRHEFRGGCRHRRCPRSQGVRHHQRQPVPAGGHEQGLEFHSYAGRRRSNHHDGLPCRAVPELQFREQSAACVGRIPSTPRPHVMVVGSEMLGMVEGPRMRMGQISAQQKRPGYSSERPGHFKCCRTRA